MMVSGLDTSLLASSHWNQGNYFHWCQHSNMQNNAKESRKRQARCCSSETKGSNVFTHFPTLPDQGIVREQGYGSKSLILQCWKTVGLLCSPSVLSKYKAEGRMCNSLYTLWGCGFPFGSFAAIFGGGFCLFLILFVLLGDFLGSFGSHFFPTRSIPWPHSLPHLHKHLGWHNAGNGAEAGTYSPRKGVGRSEVPS